MSEAIHQHTGNTHDRLIPHSIRPAETVQDARSPLPAAYIAKASTMIGPHSISIHNHQRVPDIRHLTRKVWLMAAIAVALILASGATCRYLHAVAKQQQQQQESPNVGAR